MAIEVIKQLEVAKAKVAELESSLEKEIKQKLSSLHSEFGFSDLESFIKALKYAADAPRPGRKPGRPAKAAKVAKVEKAAAAPAAPKAEKAPKAAGKKRGKRARITPELKAQVKAAVEAGKTGAAIAKELGISLPSVQNVKKELGLVKARG
ncbi:helix-turn-helix domain-containing protein [Termitidicoccus mucosus]|uniref:Uncharacterized protein n=1 Tax=Termitidicoccus mucosus TaxID=1184151 RepID=A0A178IP28_9BACT|nr:hypothetical protein AW736_02520 [Opitutaceae bacterium TSB47]